MQYPKQAQPTTPTPEERVTSIRESVRELEDAAKVSRATRAADEASLQQKKRAD